MSDRREEIELELAWLDAADAFRAAKAKRGTDDWDEDEYRATKAKVSELRTQWRGVGEALGLRSPVGSINVTSGDAPAEDPEEG